MYTAHPTPSPSLLLGLCGYGDVFSWAVNSLRTENGPGLLLFFSGASHFTDLIRCLLSSQREGGSEGWKDLQMDVLPQHERPWKFPGKSPSREESRSFLDFS